MSNDAGVPIVGENPTVLCPHCSEELEPNTATAEFSTGHIAQIFACSKCNKALSIQMIGMKPQKRSNILGARRLPIGLKQ